MEQDRLKGTTGVAQIQLALDPSLPFDQLVKVLERVLTLPELPDFGGCSPCMSGLDRFVIHNPAFRGRSV